MCVGRLPVTGACAGGGSGRMSDWRRVRGKGNSQKKKEADPEEKRKNGARSPTKTSNQLTPSNTYTEAKIKQERLGDARLGSFKPRGARLREKKKKKKKNKKKSPIKVFFC